MPGSWLRGEPNCGNAVCQSLVKRCATPSKILKEECVACREERASRRLVATGADDPRFLGHFVGAPSVFATNVRKCHTNKVRAEAFAGRAGRELHYVVAQDRASAAVVREKPNLAQEKLAWLQRHDRECGELCGMLPLCEGMPVFLTDHVNRKRNFKLLKGRKGYVRGWQHATDGAVLAEPGTVVWCDVSTAGTCQGRVPDHTSTTNMVSGRRSQAPLLGSHAQAAAATACICHDCTSSPGPDARNRCYRGPELQSHQRCFDSRHCHDARSTQERSAHSPRFRGRAVSAGRSEFS